MEVIPTGREPVATQTDSIAIQSDLVTNDIFKGESPSPAPRNGPFLGAGDGVTCS